MVVRPLDLNDVVRCACEALERELPHGVRVRVVASGRPLVIDGDESQVAQLVLSLVVNAAEATEARPGLVTVRTSACDVSAEEAAGAAGRSELPPGPCARLEVIDAGTGMPADVLARVFEPFYSTRLTGRGLGLPAALGIARGHRGILAVDSTPGEGTVVTVLLPLRRGE